MTRLYRIHLIGTILVVAGVIIYIYGRYNDATGSGDTEWYGKILVVLGLALYLAGFYLSRKNPK